MLRFDDARWQDLRGGYRIPFDPRPLLSKLESKQETEKVWHELWNELHHQGDVGEASYAAVPHLVRIYRQQGTLDWNTYAIVATIELARAQGKNPDVPDWLAEDYFAAIRSLAENGAREILDSKDIEMTRSILSVLAIAAGTRTHARFLIDYSDEELTDLETRAQQ